jgi:undecaprenyl-diphosphatase
MNEFLAWLMMGMIEGVTDILPVSSTGHMSLARQILDLDFFNLSLAAGLHGGSLIAVTLFFRQELQILWRAFIGSLKILAAWITRRTPELRFSPETTIPYLYGLSLVPVAIEGWKFRPIAQGIFAHDYFPLLFLVVNGVIILITTWFVKGERTVQELHWYEFLVVGIIHGLAVVPGISRLGLVLCMGLWYRLKWQEAVKLTFILSVPVVIGAVAMEIGEILRYMAGDLALMLAFLAGNLLAFTGSWLGLRLLTSRLLERKRLALFGYYCVMLGTFSTLYLQFWK